MEYVKQVKTMIQIGEKKPQCMCILYSSLGQTAIKRYINHYFPKSSFLGAEAA